MALSLYVSPSIFAYNGSQVIISRHGFSPVIPISSNVTRGARRALECHFRGLHLWKYHPLRVECVLVRSISFVSACRFSLSSVKEWLAEQENDREYTYRFSKMVAAIRKRFTAKDTKAHSAPQHTNIVDRHAVAKSENYRTMTRRGEAKRQHIS
jgi:hypothetical protein